MPELVADFLREHCGGEGLSPHTVQFYTTMLEPWLRWCAERGLTDPRTVSPETLGDYAKYHRTRSAIPPPGTRPRPPRMLSPHTVNRHLRAVRALFSWAELNGYIELSPFRRWRLKQPKLPVQRGFTAEDVGQLIDETYRQAEHARRDRAVVLVLWDTGMRRGELAGLRLVDVAVDGRLARTVTVHGKGDKERRLELHPQTRRALEDYLRFERPAGSSDRLFLGRWGRALAPEAVRGLVRRLALRAGLTGPRLSPHTFRHGFTRAYLDQEGARVDDLQILLGHSSVQMTLHYAGQVAAEARRGARAYSPVNQLGLHLGKRLPRGRPKKNA